MARNEQLIRQHKILQLLEASRFGRTLEEIRDELVSELGLTRLHERTVRRDIEALEAAGFDIQSEAVQRGRVWKLGRRDRGIHRISVTASELIALSIGRDLLHPLAGTQYWQGIEAFWNKVREELPAGVWEHYERYRKALHVFGIPAKKYENQEGILRTINRAILEHRVVEIVYESVGKAPAARRIEPYGLAVYQSSIYVVAAAAEAPPGPDRLRHWKLDRFHRAEALDEWFKPDPDVDLREHLTRSIGIFSGESTVDVEIRLSAKAAAWVREDPWHPEQRLEIGDDGTHRFIVPATHPRELMPKVLALGAEAQVVAPETFRDAVAEVVRQMSAAYGPATEVGHSA